ncbi:hypothetical protein TNCV_672071 [Trichonephila clavipes]|nr:hypothetical protein TNCV_672071 [Trichonephila clavipes]
MLRFPKEDFLRKKNGYKPFQEKILLHQSIRMQACHEFEPSTTKDRRVGQRCTLNLLRAEMSSRGAVWLFGERGASSGVVHVT